VFLCPSPGVCLLVLLSARCRLLRHLCVRAGSPDVGGVVGADTPAMPLPPTRGGESYFAPIQSIASDWQKNARGWVRWPSTIAIAFKLRLHWRGVPDVPECLSASGPKAVPSPPPTSLRRRGDVEKDKLQVAEKCKLQNCGVLGIRFASRGGQWSSSSSRTIGWGGPDVH